jgi:hypothetical protein
MNRKPIIKTVEDLRRFFWADHPQFQHQYRAKLKQNSYPADIRTAWVDYVDALSKDGRIPAKLAAYATL